MLKNIIFDLGGVLLDIDYQRPVQAFAALGITGFEAMYGHNNANNLFEQLETGRISDAAFLSTMAAQAPQPLTHQQVEAAWNSIILHFRKKSLAFIDELRQHYRVYLLSNTNSIHYRFYQQLYQRTTSRQSLDACFTHAWYSHRIGLRKPGAEIYERVLAEGRLLPQETLFVDDSAVNTAAAAALGIHTHLLLPHQTIETISYGII